MTRNTLSIIPRNKRTLQHAAACIELHEFTRCSTAQRVAARAAQRQYRSERIVERNDAKTLICSHNGWRYDKTGGVTLKGSQNRFLP